MAVFKMEEGIFKISRDKDRANDLFKRAEDRFNLIKIIPREKTYKIIEEYYEVIKEALTAIMYIDGYKTLSHIKLIEYFSSRYKELNEIEIKLIDSLRKLRHGSVYYGENINHNFLLNNEQEILKIIKILFKFTEKKLKED